MPKTCPICQTTYPDTDAFCPKDGTTLRADEASGDLIGSVIADRYLISKLLGEGGMGRVYLAGHVRLPQQAAIKVLHPAMVSDQGAVARFNREAANAARIEHDRVARVFDFGETSDGMVYIAMEFVPGRTLRSVLEEQKRLPPARAANLIYQIAEGLDAAHRINIVHRDLKPDNVMVSTDESGIDRSKVVDFGIAKLTDPKAGQGTQLTQAGSVIGTPEFMSPEQVFGDQLDARSDVYALALVGYQMFTGLLPFDASTPERSLTARITSDPRPLSSAAPEVAWPPALQGAFDKALAREPADRTPSALDFADAVVAATEVWLGIPVLRTRTPLSTAAMVMEPTLGSVNAGTVRGAIMTPPVTAAPVIPVPVKVEAPVAVKSRMPMMLAVVGVVVAVSAGGYYFMTRESGVQPSSTTAAADSTTVPGNTPTPPAGPTTTPRGSTGKPVAANGAVPAPPVVPANTAGQVASPPNTTGAPVVTDPAAAARNAAASEDAVKTLDSLQNAIAAADDASEVSVAVAAISRLDRVLPLLVSRSDSARAYIALATSYGMANDPLGACKPWREAKRLAVGAVQARIVQGLSELLTCAP